MYTVVVGVDGSETSLEALRFAIAEARLRGGRVKAVWAWHVPIITYQAAMTAAPIDVGEYKALAESSLGDRLERVGAAECGVEVTPVVVEGQPAHVLCQVAAGADLLVVGSRGLGGFRGLLLGSVSQQCAHHALCPVVIIRGPEASHRH